MKSGISTGFMLVFEAAGYSSSPLTLEDTIQNPQWLRRISNITKHYIYCAMFMPLHTYLWKA